MKAPTPPGRGLEHFRNRHGGHGEFVSFAAWFAEQALASPGNLEAAAREIVGLVTGLLGLLLALLCAVTVLWPRRTAASSRRPDRQKAAFDRMLAWKAWGLRAAALAFGLGVGLLGAILIVALLRVV